MSEDALEVRTGLIIPRHELTYRATRSGGAGGQHVNTSSTRIELLWDLSGSTAVSEAQRARIREKLAGRLDAEGNVRIVASDRRSQLQNRAEAEARLVTLVAGALRERKVRRATKPSRASREARLTDKKRRSRVKRDRRGGVDD